MWTFRISHAARGLALAALLGMAGCAAYPGGSDYSVGYYDGAAYPGWYDGGGIGLIGWGGPYHPGWHHGFDHPHFAGGFHPGFGHGGFAHGGFGHAGFAHAGGGHGFAHG